MTLNWHAVEGEMLIEGDYQRVILQEDQRQLLLLSKGNLWICDLDSLEVKHMLALESVVVNSARLDEVRQRLYMGTEYSNKLLTIDLNSLQVIETSMKTSCRALAISSSRQEIYWLSTSAISIVSIKGKKPRPIRQVSSKGKEMGWELALSPNGQHLALARRQGGELYCAENLSFRAGLEFPESVQDMMYSPNGEWLASVGGMIHVPKNEDGETDLLRTNEAYYTDALLILWNGQTGECLSSSPEHAMSLNRVAWHPQLPLLVTDSDEAAIQFWNWDSKQRRLHPGDQLHFPAYHSRMRDVVFTRDGQHLLALSSRGLLEFRLEGIASLRQPQPLVRQAEHTLDTGMFYANQFTWHKGHLWISNSRQWAEYDPGTRELLQVSPVDEHAFGLYVSPQHGKVLRYRSSNNESHRIEVRSLESALLTSIRDISKGEDEFSPGYGFKMRLEDDGEHLTFIQNGEINRVSIHSPHKRQTRQFEAGSLIHASLKSPSGLAVTIGGVQEIVRLWNARTLASLTALQYWPLEDLAGYVTDAILQSSGLLALGTSKGEVRVYDLNTERRVMRGTRHREGRINALAFDSNDQQLASAAEDGTVRLWDLESGEEIAVFVHEHSVQQVAFHPEQQELISMDQHGALRTWNLVDLDDWVQGIVPEAPTSPEVASIQMRESGWPDYQSAAERRQLGRYAERSWKLHSDSPPHQAPPQAGEDLVDAYQAARTHQEAFKQKLVELADAVGAEWKVRPGTGLKDANRSVEKMTRKPRRLPADLLGGTLIVPTIAQMYDVAEQVGRHFSVVSFLDRMIHPTPSLYGDLQFSVSLENHLAEVKIQHRLFHEIDGYEHRLYEIQRSMDAQFQDEDLPLAEQIVGTTLEMSSRHMYNRAWRWITAHEEGLA